AATLGHSRGSSAGSGRCGPWKASESPSTSSTGRSTAWTGSVPDADVVAGQPPPRVVGAAGERGPAAVADAADRGPRRGGQGQKPAHQPGYEAAVGHQHDGDLGLDGGVLLVELLDDGQGTAHDVDARLPAGRGPRRVRAPGGDGARPTLFDLGYRAALPLAQMRLAQPGVVLDGDAAGRGDEV